MEEEVKDLTNISEATVEVISGEQAETIREDLVGKKSGLFLEKLELEIKNGYRLFTYKDKRYKIFMPTVREDTIINEQKTQLVSKLLKNKDLMMKDEIIENLKSRGVWNDTKEREEIKLRESISSIMTEIMVERAKDEPDQETIREKQKDKLSIEIDMNLLTRSKDYLMQSTLESKIDEELLKYKVSLLVKNEDDSRVWNSVEEFEAYNDKLFINTVSIEGIYFWAGLDQSMFA